MYFIELIAKKLGNRKNNKAEDLPIMENPEEISAIDEYENCEHIFMPLDSSGETLACTNCGFVIKKEDLHKYSNNPFEKGSF